MPDLDEDLIRQITEKVTREIVAALQPEPVVEDEYPDWNEYVDETRFERVEPAPEVQDVGASPLRERLTKGVVELAPTIEDDDEGVGDVIPMGAVSVASSSGFRGGEDWLNAQWQRLPQSYRNPSQLPGWATEQWSEVV